jgi:pimeloyl-ACP methyl ester carboxylesterase
MSLNQVSRRHMLCGLGAAGLGFSKPGFANSLAKRPALRILEGFEPGRFGQVHYRFQKPLAKSHKVPLLCLHASPGSSIVYLDFLAQMGTDRLAIAADTPGYGLSDHTPNPPTIGDFADAMCDLLDGLGLTRIDLLGNHTSSATAVELAIRRPDLVRRVVIHSALMFTPEDRNAYRAKMANVAPPDLETALSRLPERWRALRKIRPEWSEERAWAMLWETSRDPMHVGWGYTASFDYDFAPAFMQLQQPALVLNPKDELFEITSRARGLNPKAQVKDLPWSSGSFAAHCGDLASEVRRFLDG